MKPSLIQRSPNNFNALSFAIGYHKDMRLVQVLLLGILLVASVYIISNPSDFQKPVPEVQVAFPPDVSSTSEDQNINNFASSDLPEANGSSDVENIESGGELAPDIDLPVSDLGISDAPNIKDVLKDIGSPYIEGDEKGDQ